MIPKFSSNYLLSHVLPVGETVNYFSVGLKITLILRSYPTGAADSFLGITRLEREGGNLPTSSEI